MEVVRDGLIKQFAVRGTVQKLAWTAMATALLAWLAAKYWGPSLYVSPSPTLPSTRRGYCCYSAATTCIWRLGTPSTSERPG
jgi:hypothetical protein